MRLLRGICRATLHRKSDLDFRPALILIGAISPFLQVKLH